MILFSTMGRLRLRRWWRILKFSLGLGAYIGLRLVRVSFMNGVGISANVFVDSFERVLSVGVVFQVEASAEFGPIRCESSFKEKSNNEHMSRKTRNNM